MAENLSIEKSPINSILECPLCLQQLKLPQTLQQCLHSFCKSCLDKVPQKTQDGRQGWLCPMCENFTRCDQVQQSMFIEELQKIHSEPKNGGKIKCEQCLDDCGEAIWKCAECKIGLCENGKAVHLKIPMLKDHKILPLEKDGERLIDNIVYCKVHYGIPAQLNCRDCAQLICYTCKITNHEEHKAETVEQALERILPETDISARQVNENISIIEAQIQGVNKEMEETKELYASCRMQMDEHLEKVICQMRAMKAQLEEDVNEQESMALDTLKELQKQLEKQLGQASVISNLTDVVTTKTRHTSQLQQLQTGLFEQIKSAGEFMNQSISFNFQATNFVEGESLQEEIDNVYGKLCFDMKDKVISSSGKSLTNSNQFLSRDFNKLAKSQFKKDKEIAVKTSWCNRLSYINNKIWLPLDSRKKINIYDLDGELQNETDTGDKAITVVRKVHNGDVICAGESGLFVTDIQFTKWTMLSKGKFSDVVVNKDQFIAFEYDLKSVHIYSRVNAVDNPLKNSWHICHSFTLTKEVKVTCNSGICIIDEQYLLISSTPTKALYKFTCGGERVDSCKDLPFHPIICGTDENDHLLLADYTKGTLYLFKPLSEKVIKRTAILSDLHTPETRSVVVDCNNNIWVLSGSSDTFKIIKFTSQQ